MVRNTLPPREFSMSHRLRELLIAMLALICAPGCTTPSQAWQSLKGDGFPTWNQKLGSGIRASQDAQPSGYFTDRRSEQIEQDLGGF